jgi:hypothetical protein
VTRHTLYVALDGNGINGLEGQAGVCALRYDPSDESYAWKVSYFDGVSAGHAVSINPDRTVGFLGNAGQHLLFFAADTLEEVGRISTLRYEPADTTIRGSTHLVWLDPRTFVTAIGDFFYRFDLDRLDKGEPIAQHGVLLPHAMKTTASGRYVVYGSMDHPQQGESRQVGIWDLHTGEVRVVPVPATCWHVATHRHEDLFYALTFRVLPQEGRDWHQWAIAFMKEYALEIGAESGAVMRHWSAGRETPSHLNSDVVVSDTELIWCNGASQTVILLDLADMASFRVVDERPSAAELWNRKRTMANQVFDVLARGSYFTSNQHILSALRASRFTLMDSLFGTALTADQRLLFTANRGLNRISIYDYPSTSLRARLEMPDIQTFVPWVSARADPRLGFHHSTVISDAPGPHSRTLVSDRAGPSRLP